MPLKLPRYNAQVNAPSKSGGVVVEHPEYLTVGINTGIGKILQNAGKEGMEISNAYEAKKEQARKTVELANFNANIYTKKAEWEEGLKKRDDYQNFDNDFVEYAKKTKEELLSPIVKETDKKVYEARLNKELLVMGINTSKIHDLKMFNQQEINYYSHIVPSFEKMIEREQDPELRQGYIEQFKSLTSEYVNSNILTPQQGLAQQKIVTIKTDIVRMKNDITADPLAWQGMSDEERSQRYPHLMEEQFIQGDEYAYKMEQRNEREANQKLKEIHSNNAVEANKQWRAFQAGNNPNFEEWLDQKWMNEEISDGLYNTMTNKAYMKKESWGNKMTASKWKVYSGIEQEILKDSSSIQTLDDLYNNRDFQALPDGKQGNLASILGKNVPVKNAIKYGNKIINDSFLMSGIIDAVEKDDVRSQFMNSIEGVDDPKEIHKIAREIAQSNTGSSGAGQAVKERTTGTETKTKTGKEKTPFDEANLASQARWLSEREPLLKEQLKGKGAGVYPIKIKNGGTVWIEWNPSEGRLTMKQGGAK